MRQTTALRIDWETSRSCTSSACPEPQSAGTATSTSTSANTTPTLQQFLSPIDFPKDKQPEQAETVWSTKSQRKEGQQQVTQGEKELGQC